MKHREFEDRIKLIKPGDLVKLTCRGNYGNYLTEGVLQKVENGRIYFRHGSSHHYKRILEIIIVHIEVKFA